MEFYRGAADNERFRDLIIIESFDHEVKNFALALCKVMAYWRCVLVRCRMNQHFCRFWR